MSKYVGLSFEELEEQEMINIQGGATPTSATVTSSLVCGAATFATAVSVTLLSLATIKVF